jgi:Clp amino terminal domain, pathogenicity island component
MTSEDLYRVLLKAYPLRYRRQYEEAMAQHFRDQLRAADTWSKRVSLWYRTLADFARSVPARHLEPRRDGPHFYTERARRAIWMAQNEAASFAQGYVGILRLGGGEVGLEHLLLGTLRSDPELATTLLGPNGTETIARSIQIEQAHPGIALRAEERARIPFSQPCKRALGKAAQEAQNSGVMVSSRHVLLGILYYDTSLAARVLRKHAVVDLSCLRTIPDPNSAGPKD